MAQSCDVMFYQVGLKLGPDRIHSYASQFGFGSKTGIGFSDEAVGLIPSTEWKQRAFRKPEDQRWYQGETPSVAIGQGAVSVTPIQIARALAAVANGGTVYRPHIVERIFSLDGQFSDTDFPPEMQHRIDIEPWIFETVKKELIAVVNDPQGTGKKARLPPEYNITVAGKTGTSQVIGGDHGHATGKYADHAWFAGFAPAEKPEIVVVALVENGGHGGAVAAPVARAIMQRYFEKTRGIVMGPPRNPSKNLQDPLAQDAGGSTNVD